jgi:hypothetical protein
MMIPPVADVPVLDGAALGDAALVADGVLLDLRRLLLHAAARAAAASGRARARLGRPV